MARAEAPAPAADPGEQSTATAADTALQRMAAGLLPFMQEASGLPARSALKLATRTRAELEAYLERQLAEDLPPATAAALGRVYARFGLIPETLDISGLLRTLLLEQVVGYYDPERDTLYVIDSVPLSQVEAVLAHEIVHALQDQYVDLDSLMTSLKDRGDRAAAARAALEGHATYAMLEWQWGQLTGNRVDLTQLPNLTQALGADPLALAGVEMPALREAPRVIREGLLFPYLGGLGFVQSFWSRRGSRVTPLGDALPGSTEVIMHPERYWPTLDEPTDVFFDEDLPEGWDRVSSDALGEHETRIFLEEFLLEQSQAERAAAGWDGDRYALYDGPGGEVLLWVTVWDSDNEAAEFEAAAREAFARRYSGDGAPGAEGAQAGSGRDVILSRHNEAGRPIVIVWDLPVGVSSAELDGALTVRLEGGE
ncbi:MAG: hypothetical protein V3U67_02755 [Gemmatimonadota bacterium]